MTPATYARFSAGLLVCLLPWLPLRADEPAQPSGTAKQLPLVEMTLTPRPEPDPPLKYSLVPAYPDIKPGNAATWYYRAILLLPREKERAFGEEQSNWLSLPLAQFPQDKARTFLEAYRNAIHETRTATFCDHCDWGLQLRELKGMDTLNFLFPELQETRTLARVLRIKARLQIAQGQYEEAIDTLVMSYRLAENVARSPVLISNLVGVAIANLTNESLRDWIESGGPNLYWAIVSLPAPLVDMREALKQEMNLPLQMFPFLKDPENTSYTPDQWRQMIGESMQRFAEVGGRPRPEVSNLIAQTAATGLIMAGYSTAKQALIKSGMDPQKVDAMPVGQVVAIQSARAYRKVYQESMKWTLLPYWQSYRQMRDSFESLRQEGYLGGSLGQVPGVLPIAQMFLPAIESAILSPTRMQRELDALRTIEALRWTTAASGGKLPASLADLQQCPAPIDPVTGTPFVYRLEDDTAIIELSPPERMDPQHFGKRYKIRIGTVAGK